VRDGVKIIEEYLPNIQVVYQLADVYIFPTISRDYVIDIPLSAIEALACGTPVITHRNILEVCHIPLVKQDVLIVHDPSKDINQEVSEAVLHKAKESFVDAAYSWENMAYWFYREYHDLMAET
jgi:glycosyltransferase involved in cell wall biosynthesis